MKNLDLELSSFSIWLVLTCDKTLEPLISTFQLTGTSNEGRSTTGSVTNVFVLQSPDDTRCDTLPLLPETQ